MQGDSWHSYPKVYNMGHAALTGAFAGPVLVEEKVDGSQFSFGRFGSRLRVRSKGREFDPSEADKLFQPAVDAALERFDLLHDGWTYRGEALCRPKHNTLAYDRVPRDGVILFDVNDGHESYLGPEAKQEEAERLGLEVVPVMHHARIGSADEVLTFLDRTSILGGALVEGVVLKDYSTFLKDGKVAMGKYVAERFREMHKSDWKARNPAGRDILAILSESARTEARWQKAVQHLRDRGELTGSPRDIGPLMREVQVDIEAECADELKDELWKWARKKVLRGSTVGLADWYKRQLLTEQFEAKS